LLIPKTSLSGQKPFEVRIPLSASLKTKI